MLYFFYMAKVTSPLFSITASGTFANLLTFSNNQNGAFIKRFAGNSKIKGNTPSEKQIKDRYNFNKANLYYKILSVNERKDIYSSNFDKTNSPRNIIFREYITKKPTDIGFFELGNNKLGSIL